MLSLLSLLLPGLLSPAFAAERTSTANYTTGTLTKPKIGYCPKECVDNPSQSACEPYKNVCSFNIEATVKGTPIEQLIDNGGTCGNCEPPPQYLLDLLGLRGNTRDYLVISATAQLGKVKTAVAIVRPATITQQQRTNGTLPIWMAYRGDIDRDGDIDQFGGSVTINPGRGIQAPLADLVVSVPETRGETRRRDAGR